MIQDTIYTENLTVYHVLNCLRIIFRQVNDTGLCLEKRVTACSIEERRSGGQECPVYGVSSPSTDNGQI